MAITLQHVCRYAKEKYGMIQLAGLDYMNNLVSWVHMLEDPETAHFLHGQELIFTTGIGHADTEWFLDFAKRLVENNASGLVLNIGPYIQAVPEALLDYCQGVGFPLFTIPWETRIVDITNDFCHRIMKAEESELTVETAFRNAIFHPDNEVQYRSVLSRKAFDLSRDFSVLMLYMVVEQSSNLHGFSKNLKLHVSKQLFRHSDRFALFRQDNQLVVIVQSLEDEAIEDLVERLQTMAYFGKSEQKFYAGYSGRASGILSLSHSYQRALEVAKIAFKRGKSFLSYEGIGVHQLFIEVEDKRVLENYYRAHLGVLEDYDEQHGSDYCLILRRYLEANNSVEKLAKDLFVHRNTVNYKIKKIKEILGIDLDNKAVAQLMLAFSIKAYL